MRQAWTAQCLNRALRIGEAPSIAQEIPVYLCPALRITSRPGAGTAHRQTRLPYRTIPSQRRLNHGVANLERAHTVDASASTVSSPIASNAQGRRLPLTCSGCGAFAQTADPEQFGYFDTSKQRIRKWLRPSDFQPTQTEDFGDGVVNAALKAVDSAKLEKLGLSEATLGSGSAGEDVSNLRHDRPPVCDRCHDLVHHSLSSNTAKSVMHHPTVESLRETIEESPHKYNHIYHVIDAADFPMSLIPRLNVLLGDIPLRTRNRRSRASKYQKDGKMEMSFLISRGDLLGPTKEIVDSMMPYLREVLRDALGRLGGRVRLGNVRCVSAKRAWWTKVLKEDIWKRGGAGWMVGKVNVGKSQLFEAVYPKGRVKQTNPLGGSPERVASRDLDGSHGSERESSHDIVEDDMDAGELLPPPQPAVNYPEMPIVSSLPGTTASPIRIPFGNGKGELIDLPGMARSDLEKFVKEAHRQSLIMQKRIVPEQISAKSNQSLLLGGGLVRITPRTPDMRFLMYNFTPLDEHLTMTSKAVDFQDQSRTSIAFENISTPEAARTMKHAGTFKLCYDVTKKRAGPLTRKNALGLSVDRLPFRVLSIDILIEGVGYVEVVAQVRARSFQGLEEPRSSYPDIIKESEPGLESVTRPMAAAKASVPEEVEDPFAAMVAARRAAHSKSKAKPDPIEPDWTVLDWPAVDVYTPEGRFVAARKPINGWLNNKPLVLAKHKKSRPRKSMRGQKKKEKMEKRAKAETD